VYPQPACFSGILRFSACPSEFFKSALNRKPRKTRLNPHRQGSSLRPRGFLLHGQSKILRGYNMRESLLRQGFTLFRAQNFRLNPRWMVTTQGSVTGERIKAAWDGIALPAGRWRLCPEDACVRTGTRAGASFTSFIPLGCLFCAAPAAVQNRTASGELHPAEAGEFSHGAFQPFAKGANGDRRAAVNSIRLKPGSSRMGPSTGRFAAGDRSARGNKYYRLAFM
jgi:hypothetical protein